MTPRALLHFGLAVHAAPAADDQLDVLSRAGATYREQPPSVSGVATRVSARTLEYDSSPRASASLSRGSEPNARATRTCSRAAPSASPTRQLSQWAHEAKPLPHPPRTSNSRIRSSSRAVAASRCAASSATISIFIGDSPRAEFNP